MLVRIAGEERLIAAEDAGRYRDALGAMPPSGLPDAFLEGGPDSLRQLVLRYAKGRGPFTTDEANERFGRDVAALLVELERDELLVRGELRPGGTEREWCDPDVLRRLRRASLAALRARGRAGRARRRSHASCPAGTASTAARRCARRSCRCRRSPLPVALWESEVLPRRVPGYRPEHLDALTASGEVVWVGAGPDRVALYFREDAAALGQVPRPPRPEGAEHDAIRAALERARSSGTTCSPRPALEEAVALPALWDLVWAGEVTNDAWTPLRADAPLRHAEARSAGRAASRAAASQGATATAGRWSRTERLFAGAPDRRALAELLLERQGIVTRDGVRAEGIPGGYGAVYAELRALETLGLCRRGYFVEGLGGAQFALGGAVERLRELRDAPRGRATRSCSPRPIPAQPYGAALPWPKRAGARAARVAGAYVVSLGGEPVLYVERGGRSLVPLRDPDEDWLRPALAALVAHVQAGGRSGSRSSASTASRSSRARRCRCSSRPASSPGRAAPSYGRNEATISAAGNASACAYRVPAQRLILSASPAARAAARTGAVRWWTCGYASGALGCSRMKR